MGRIPSHEDDAPRTTGEVAEFTELLDHAVTEEQKLAVELKFVRQTANGPWPDDPPFVSPKYLRLTGLHPIVQKVLVLAEADVGTSESPPFSNCTKYNPWYGFPCAAWCAMALSYWFWNAGLPLPATTSLGFAYCPSGVNWFRQNGWWLPASAAVEPGYPVFFNFGSGEARHVGVVRDYASAGDPVATIEGNTSSGDSGSQDNGGGVFRRLRARSAILGFGVPPLPALADEEDDDYEMVV